LEGGVTASDESVNRDAGTSTAEQVGELSKQLLLSSTIEVKASEKAAQLRFSLEHPQKLVGDRRADADKVEAGVAASSQGEVDQVWRAVVQHQQVAGVKVAVDDALRIVSVKDLFGAL
jgi:hypothetical protein